MDIKLFYSPGACSLAPHIILEELGKPFSLKLVSTSDGSTQKDEHLRINPKGKVPVLTYAGSVLTEAPAILLFLGMQNPESNLLPTSNENFVRCAEWFNWLSGTVHSVAIRQIWRPESFSDSGDQLEAIVASGKSNLQKAFALVEQRLTLSDWAVADKYSVVDPYILVFYRWGNRMGLAMKEKYPFWTKHTMQLLKRPAVERAIKTEEISIWK
jgi:glutathione S-transferase